MATVFTNVGRQIATGRLLNTTPSAGNPGSAAPRYVSWGTGAGTSQATDTSLFTESQSTTNDGTHNLRVTGTDSQVTSTVSNDTYQVTGTLTADTAKTITNAATFDTSGQAANLSTAPSGGNMFMKADFVGVALNSGDAIQFTFKWQLT